MRALIHSQLDALRMHSILNTKLNEVHFYSMTYAHSSGTQRCVSKMS